MNLFLDTNIWLRYIIGDHAEHLKISSRLLELNEESRLKVATSSFVLSEVLYTQQSFYNIKRVDTILDINTISSTKGLLLVEKTDITQTLEMYTRSINSKWSDCMIAAQVPTNYRLCSFDRGMKKIIGASRFISPEEVVATF